MDAGFYPKNQVITVIYNLNLPLACSINAPYTFFMTMRQNKINGEQGSVIFFILIGVALFAALSFAVSNINRTGNADITDEVAGLAASEIVQTATAYKNAVRSARIEGCADTDISFESTYLSGYVNTNNPPDNCEIFNQAANSTSYVKPQTDWLDSSNSGSNIYGQWFFAQGVCALDVGSGGSDCDDDSYKDLIAILPFIKRDICRVIDERQDIIVKNAPPPVEAGDAWRSGNTRFTGDFSGGDIKLERDGALSGCFEGSGGNTPPSGTYHYFQVLLSR